MVEEKRSALSILDRQDGNIPARKGYLLDGIYRLAKAIYEEDPETISREKKRLTQLQQAEPKAQGNCLTELISLLLQRADTQASSRQTTAFKLLSRKLELSV
jgi:ornithine cyclodeaminase/alanine dehydrogenase-like protein (mu-crystallin family)